MNTCFSSITATCASWPFTKAPPASNRWICWAARSSWNKGASLKFLLAEVEETIAAASAHEELKFYADQLTEQLGLTQKVLGYLMPMAAQGEFEKMLSDATLFMEFFSNIIVAWQWLKLGVVASSANSDFHKAKIHTLKFFYQYELSKNKSLAHTIMQPQRLTIVGPVEVLD